MNTETIARRIKEQILSFDERLDVREQGRVMSCADGIARVSGLQDVMAGELLVFSSCGARHRDEPGRRHGRRCAAG